MLLRRLAAWIWLNETPTTSSSLGRGGIDDSNQSCGESLIRRYSENWSTCQQLVVQQLHHNVMIWGTFNFALFDTDVDESFTFCSHIHIIVMIIIIIIAIQRNLSAQLTIDTCKWMDEVIAGFYPRRLKLKSKIWENCRYHSEKDPLLHTRCALPPCRKYSQRQYKYNNMTLRAKMPLIARWTQLSINRWPSRPARVIDHHFDFGTAWT